MGEIVLAIVEEVAKCFVAPIGRQFSYLCSSNSNFDRLKEEVERLTGAKESVSHSVDEAERKGEEIENCVKNWLIRVEKIMDEARKMIEDKDNANSKCFKGLCPNLKTRYQLSKRAVRTAESIAGLKEEGNFDKISYSTIPPETWLPASRDFQFFESRLSTLRNIQNALSDSNVNMIGVYGLGGVGKTTLVKEIAKEAEKRKLFDQVIFANVSPTPDIRQIQGEIADKLGLELHEESLSGRARKLRETLSKKMKVDKLGLELHEESLSGRARKLRETSSKKMKVLIILDNIWTRVDLETIGVPFGDEHKGCKVLLTARDQDVLSSKMNCEKNFAISTLNEDEAWSLFKKIAGECIENSDVQVVATEVAKKCGGLPIAITTIASALRNKNVSEWKHALTELRRPSKKSLAGVQAEAYSTTMLSYNHLEDDDLKYVFLLCSLMHDQAFVSDLLKYGIGLGLSQGTNTIEEARNKIYTLVRKLQASCLLLEGEGNNQFTMHDIVRDVALSVEYKNKHAFARRNEVVPIRWPAMDTFQNCIAIGLYENNIDELPEGLKCPQLEFFYFKNQGSIVTIPDNFFIGMTELKVIDLTEIQLLSLPSSIRLLVNLQTLCLDRCVLGDIAVIGELRKLEVLSLIASNIEELPKEIGQLSLLRLLDLSRCSKLKVIPPNVLSSLSQLEELCMDYTFVQWEIDGLNFEKRNSSLHELKLLPHLTNLQIHIKDAKMLPKGHLFSQKPERYQICIGDTWGFSMELESKRTLKLKLNTCMEDEVIMQLKGMEVLYLDEVQHMKNVLYEEYKEGFAQLQNLFVQNNSSFQCLMDSMVCVPHEAFPSLESLVLANLMNLEKICHDQLSSKSFGKLRIIEVDSCHKLKNIFSLSINKSLSQLQTIKVTRCLRMEEIFVIEEEDDFKNNEAIDKNKFGHLRFLTLGFLPSLRSFCSKVERPSTSRRSGQKNSSGDVLDSDPIALVSEMVVLPNLESLEVYAVTFEKIWHNPHPAMSSCVPNLTRLIVGGCLNLKYLFSSSTVRSFRHLQHLEIFSCPVLKEIIVMEELREEGRGDTTFPQLKFLKIKDVGSLKTFCLENRIDFPSLKQLQIEQCPEFKAFISNSESICVQLTDGRELVIQPFFDEKVAFPELEEMVISDMDNLEMIWHNKLAQDSFEKLKSMEVKGCNKLQWTLFPSNMLGRLSRLESLTVGGCESLKNILPVSIARTLLQLEKLEISGCGLLEEIVSKEEAEASSVKFVFPKVTHLSLGHLPQLSNFYPGVHTLELPMLKTLIVFRCGKANAFGLEFLENKEEGQIDIPAQQPLFLVEKMNPNLEALILSRKDFRMIWYNRFQGHFFSKIKFLCIGEDESTVFQFSLLERFYNLEHLCLICGSYKELLSFEEVEKHFATLARIKILGLHAISGLKDLLIQDWRLNEVFQDLEELVVTDCENLIHLLPPSASFKNLTTLNVLNCNGMMKFKGITPLNSHLWFS